MMPIIIEGADRVGKTTLARTLAESLEYKYQHLSAPDEEFDHETFYYVNLRPDTVWDRYHLGAVVYGSWLHLSRPMCNELRREVHKEMFQSAFIVILYTSDQQLLKQRYDPRTEAYTLENIADANRLYKSMTSAPGWCHFSLDVAGLTKEQVAKEVQDAYARFIG